MLQITGTGTETEIYIEGNVAQERAFQLKCYQVKQRFAKGDPKKDFHTITKARQ